MKQDVKHTSQNEPSISGTAVCSCATDRAASSPKQMPACGAAIFSKQAWEAVARSLELSGRQLQMVRAVFDDHTECAIAANLGISAHTVHTHFERLHLKLGVADRVGVVLCVTNVFLSQTASLESGLPSICASRNAGRCPLER